MALDFVAGCLGGKCISILFHSRLVCTFNYYTALIDVEKFNFYMKILNV